MSNEISKAVLRELAAITKAEGILRAESVIAYARDPESALHHRFTWDDTAAAHQYRLEQARRLIRCAVVVLPVADVQYRAFVSLGSDRVRPGGGYRITASVLSDDAQRAELLAQALTAFQRVRRRYQGLQELDPVFAALDAIQRRGVRRQTLHAAGT